MSVAVHPFKSTVGVYLLLTSVATGEHIDGHGDGQCTEVESD